MPYDEDQKIREKETLGLNNYEELKSAKRIWFFKCPECKRINFKMHDIRSVLGGKFAKKATRGCYKCGHLLDYEQDRIGDTREYRDDDVIACRIEGKTELGWPRVQAYIWTTCVNCNEWHYLPLNSNRIDFMGCKCQKVEAPIPAAAGVGSYTPEPYGKELEPMNDIDVKEKYCGGCKLLKPVSEFYANNAKPDDTNITAKPATTKR
jgi:hypothetical protein